MNSKIQIGINVLQNQPVSELYKRWKTVEDLGFDSLWLADHFATKFRPEGIWYDGWSILAAMAVKTSRQGPLAKSRTEKPLLLWLAK